MKTSNSRLFILLSVLMLVGATSSTIAAAKTPKGCGKESSNVRVPSRILCSDGSPNSDIFKLVKRDMKRTTSLKKTSSATQIRTAICLDSRNSTGPQVDAAVEYMFAWHEWVTGGLSYKSVMQNYYYGDWDKFCSSGKSSSASVETVQTFTVPNFVGSSQAMVENWKRNNKVKVSINYSTAIGYNYLVSCRVLEKGIVLTQRPSAGSQMVNAMGNTIWLDLDC